MLTSLLPGLRDLRAPLVSGSLVLFSSVLLLGGHLDDLSAPTGRSERLDALLAWIGRPGLTAAALIGAYLIGSIVTSVSRRVLVSWSVSTFQKFDRDRGERFRDALSGGEPDSSALALQVAHEASGGVTTHSWSLPRMFPYSTGALSSFAVELKRFVQTGQYLRQWSSQASSGLLYRLLTDTFMDGPRRLRLASPDLYADFDRLQSEAELRDSLLLPVPLVAVSVLLNSSLSAAVEAAIGIMLAGLLAVLSIQARIYDRKSNSLLLGTLSDHTISVAALDPIDWAPRR